MQMRTKNETQTVVLVPIHDFPWEDKDLSGHEEMTCQNHRGMRYLTKNPHVRSIHIVDVDPSVSARGMIDCACSFHDLLVVHTYNYPEGA